MTDVVSTRLDEKEIEELNEISERERIDRSSLIRKFLLAQIQELGFDVFTLHDFNMLGIKHIIIFT